MPETKPTHPYTRPVLHCPRCGELLAITTRVTERETHDAPVTHSCARCKRSWSVPVVRVEAVSVDYDDGTRG